MMDEDLVIAAAANIETTWLLQTGLKILTQAGGKSASTQSAMKTILQTVAKQWSCKSWK